MKSVKPGDRVYWDDPDGRKCGGFGTVVSVHGDRADASVRLKMESGGETEALLHELKRAINVVVQMDGGTIQAVLIDAKDVAIENAVFTERSKYVEDDLVEVKTGMLAGEAIYSVHEVTGPTNKATMQGALAAARKYVEED